MAGAEVTITTQELIFGVTGQSLILDVVEPLSTIVSVAVHRAGDDDTVTALSATTGSASIALPSEAITVAAGRGQVNPKKLTMLDTNGFSAGLRYRIVGTDGIQETFEIDGTPSTTVIYTRHPLRNAYAIGASLRGDLRATQAVLDSWAADVTWICPSLSPNPGYRVRWQILDANSATQVYDRNFDLVRYPSVNPVGPIDVDDAYHGWLDSLPPDHQVNRGASLIAEAHRQIKIDLYRHGIADQALRNVEVFAALIIARAGALTGRAPKSDYTDLIAGLVESPALQIDKTGGGGATTNQGRGARMYSR